MRAIVWPGEPISTVGEKTTPFRLVVDTSTVASDRPVTSSSPR